MNMKNALFILAGALCFYACSHPLDPFKDALNAALEERLGEPAEKTIYTNFARIDSVTIDMELTQRINTFKLKHSQDQKFYEKFLIESKPKSAEKYRQATIRDVEILASLDSLYASYSDRLNDIAYYDYAFGVVVKGENAQLNLDKAYACITPDLRVVTITSDKKGLHKTTGGSIPGYKEIIKNTNIE